MPQFPNREPEILESLLHIFESLLYELHVAMPASIVSYYPVSGDPDPPAAGGNPHLWATVQPLLQRSYYDEDNVLQVYSYPMLYNVPVVHLRGGGAFIHMPIAAGDPALLIISERSLDAYLPSDGKTVVYTPDSRRHNASDAVALVGLSPNLNAIDLGGNTIDVLHGLAAIVQGQTPQAARFGVPAKSTDPVAKANEVEARLSALENWAKGLAVTIAGTTASPGSPIVATAAPTPFTPDASQIASSRVFVDA